MDEAGVPLVRHADDTAAVVVLALVVVLVRSSSSPRVCGNHLFHLLKTAPPDGLLRRQHARARGSSSGLRHSCPDATPCNAGFRSVPTDRFVFHPTNNLLLNTSGRDIDLRSTRDACYLQRLLSHGAVRAGRTLTASIARSFLALARRAFRSCAFMRRGKQKNQERKGC